jgi:hypothetical protein
MSMLFAASVLHVVLVGGAHACLTFVITLLLSVAVSRRNSLRYLRTLKNFMLDLLTEVSETSLQLVMEATDPVRDYLRLRRLSLLRQRIEQWYYAHL